MKKQKLAILIFALGSLPTQAQESALTVGAVNLALWQLPSVRAGL